jgi:hypothetical protein
VCGGGWGGSRPLLTMGVWGKWGGVGVCGGGGGGVWGVGCVGVWGVWGSRPLLTFDIPQTALVATLDTYDFKV